MILKARINLSYCTTCVKRLEYIKENKLLFIKLARAKDSI